MHPKLVIRGDDGRINGVRYQELMPMLLNEVQQQHERLAAQASQLACSDFCGYVVFGCIAASGRCLGRSLQPCGTLEELTMRWTSPRVVEICVGMEINCYASAEV